MKIIELIRWYIHNSTWKRKEDIDFNSVTKRLYNDNVSDNQGGT